MPEQPNRPRRPLLLGHRGTRLRDPRIPENTLPAFDYALQNGCDGFEFDVRCTNDEHLLICHDPEFFGRNVAVSSYSDLQRHWEQSGVPKLLYLERTNISDGVVGVPCLGDVLASYSGKAFLDIELKVAGLQKAVIAALRENPPQRGFVVSSFLDEVLLQFKSQDPRIPLGFIFDHKKKMKRWTTLPVEFVMPQYRLLSHGLLDEFHAAGKKVVLWTVNDPRDMRRFADWEVDGLISDDPGLLTRTFA